jgi:hypothetical protein
VVDETKTMTVVIERGVDRGHRIVFEEHCNEHPGVIPGDVVLSVTEIGPHPRFIRATRPPPPPTSLPSLATRRAGFVASMCCCGRRALSIHRYVASSVGAAGTGGDNGIAKLWNRR